MIYCVNWKVLRSRFFKAHRDHAGREEKTLVGYETVVPGKLSAVKFKDSVTDLVNFMTYMGEPIKLERQRWVSWRCSFWPCCLSSPMP